MSGAFAIVTGASRGIGRATALALAARGLPLALVGRASPELDATRTDCAAASGADVRIFPADLARPDALEALGASLLAACGAPRVVVHNAGAVLRASVEELSLESWDEQIAVNLSSPFALTRALLPAMRRAGEGRILFVASISSTLGTPRLSAYCASKWGIVGFMKSLAEELADSGLMTAAVLPGSVATRMLEGSGFPPRMSADDVARTLTFLALDAPLAHNGAAIEMFGV